MISLDLVKPVKIVHHDAGRLLQALCGGVAEPIDPLDARAIAEVEMRYRVERPTRGRPLPHKIACAQPDQGFTQSCRGPGLVVPALLVKNPKEVALRRR